MLLNRRYINIPLFLGCISRNPWQPPSKPSHSGRNGSCWAEGQISGFQGQNVLWASRASFLGTYQSCSIGVQSQAPLYARTGRVEWVLSSVPACFVYWKIIIFLHFFVGLPASLNCRALEQSHDQTTINWWVLMESTLKQNKTTT